ncbi:TPA: TetR/AcrR family transcriptional regulator [Pseudomonas aeruginosa]|uniref:TetR/AcrR family transcriptional regulator n=1 Tax=Pseudomonas citronellolis TaxID=53408 RepID=UPI001A27D9C4|nr:TetR/AcrR family transcriptional regulator [Pseudomonas citronellolis]MBH3547411.1 TetR/AcrR family transcriptional regulator [Pseudomonas aeruginosa]UUC47438.1 TetR/AcrR family transcriptional regulator [Pseudomonas citronellolis]HBN9703326.1 TetR/AcrR family transcriptional regulator [Pseudomonas aeruginosa]HBN9721874.1 TetR/AcrR family transcriptional regulator [Pseudomonas aeruginosa]HBN9767953.1 TetR/AcrR family transcriptional regulator [Pseudomonas aeruginosa]
MSKTAPRTRDTYHVGNLAPQLLAAAREMLEEVGPTKLSLRAVSERVGVSATAAYHHYANRAELIGHLAAQGFRELARVLIIKDANSPGAQRLRNASLAYFAFARSNPALYQLMFGPEFADGDMILELKDAREEAFGELRRIIAELLERKVDSTEVRRASLSSWSYIHGLASLVIHNVLHFPAGTTNERFVDSTLQGLEQLFLAGQRR